jgi:hypothetical protein
MEKNPRKKKLFYSLVNSFAMLDEIGNKSIRCRQTAGEIKQNFKKRSIIPIINLVPNTIP